MRIFVPKMNVGTRQNKGAKCNVSRKTLLCMWIQHHIPGTRQHVSSHVATAKACRIDGGDLAS